jgi:hypothetical protein
VLVTVGTGAAVAARADRTGSYTLTVQAPTRPGRFTVTASCRGRTATTPLDVVLTSASNAGGSASAELGLLAVYLLIGLVFATNRPGRTRPAPDLHDAPEHVRAGLRAAAVAPGHLPHRGQPFPG